MFFIFFKFSSAYNGCEVIFTSENVSPEPNKDYVEVVSHESDHIMILVPTIVKRKSLISVNSMAIAAVPAVFIMCVIFRKIFRVLNNDRHQDIGRIFLDNLGAFLSVNPSIRIYSRYEAILHTVILFASMILTMMIGAFVFGNLLVKDTITGIDTLQELAESKLRVYITNELNQTINFWSQNLE